MRPGCCAAHVPRALPVHVCSKCRSCADLIQNGGHKNISKEPLVINGMGGGVLGVGKPQGSSHRGALLVGLVEGSVEVGQQLVPHLDGTPACVCHRVPQIQLLHMNRLLLNMPSAAGHCLH